MSKNILAIIPARGGSKGVERKNLKLLAGKPLILHTIEAARNCSSSLKVLVSTDDHEIAKLAKQSGAEVPYMRPAELAQDDTPMIDVVEHALQWLQAHEKYHPDAVLLLQPTSPMRKSKHINDAIELFSSTNADAVVSVCEAEHSPYWMMRVDSHGRLLPFIDGEKAYTRRQDLPKIYRLNGAIYLTKREVLENLRVFQGPDTRALIMSQADSIDINTELDIKQAELILKSGQP